MTVFMVRSCCLPGNMEIEFPIADFLLQSGLATQIRFHGKRYPWFVSDVTKKDWEWLLNTMVYGQLFPKATDVELESLRRLGTRWKVRLRSFVFPLPLNTNFLP